MSLLVLGLSHHGAPIELLEAAALDTPSRGRLESAIVGSEHVVEAVVVSTCNRTEVYAEGVTFHGSLTAVSESLAAATGVPLAVDLENGHGPTPANAAESIALAGTAGAVGGSIEDYDPAEDRIYDLGHAVERIAAAAKMAAASTGNASRIRMLVMSVFHEKIGMRHMVIPGARMVSTVVMKFTAPRIVPKPLMPRPSIQRFPPTPGEKLALASG